MRKILLITLFCILLVGCKTTKQKEIIDNVASFTPTELPETDSVYEDYANHLLILKNPSSYTVGVKNIYNLYYSDDSQVEYSFDGILEAENVSNNPVISWLYSCIFPKTPSSKSRACSIIIHICIIFLVNY